MKAKHRRLLCSSCTHGLEHHPDRGPCTYGATTVFGGCHCPGFGTRKSRQPVGPVDPDELAIDARVRDANAALAALASTMKDILRRRREALAGTDVDGRIVLRGKPTDTFEIVRESKPIGRTTPSGITHKVTVDPGPAIVSRATTDQIRIIAVNQLARRILTVLAQRLGPLTRKQILLFADRRQSGDTSTAFAFLLRERYIVEAGAGGGLVITNEGKRVLGPVDPLPTGEALRAQLLANSDPFTASVLVELFEVYPDPLTRAELLERTGYRQSGDTSTAFARIVTLGHAIKVGKGGLAAGPELFA